MSANQSKSAIEIETGCLPAFSIVIATYNRPQQLAKCLAALTRLRYPKDRFEIIIVDDGGVEDLTAIIKPFADELRLRHLRQANAGPAAARNLVPTGAVEDFLAFTDDDCAPHANWLTQLAATLSKDSDVLVGGTRENALARNPFAAASQTILDVVNMHFNHDHQHAHFFPSDNIALSRRMFLEIGGFDAGFRCSEDRDFCDRWSARGWRMIFVPDAKVDHAHEMGFLGFVKQHFGYGRGAWRFHRARQMRNTGTLQIEGSFYLKCFLQPFKTHSPGSAIVLTGVLLIWQLANTAGFFYEAMKSRQSKPGALRRCAPRT